MKPTLVERLIALVGLGDRRTRTKLGLADRRSGKDALGRERHPRNIALSCSGCGAQMGSFDFDLDYEDNAGEIPWAFCSYVCVERVVQQENKWGES